MPENLRSIEQVQSHGLRPLAPLFPLFAALTAAILIWGAKPVRTPIEATLEPPPQQIEAAPPLLVTAEQLDRMCYMDSVLGEISWSLSSESVEELSHVLREYEITSPEEISQFLAQAAIETSGGRWLTELGEESYFQRYGYTTGTRGAGFFHLTFEYGQMAFSLWMMKKYVPELSGIAYPNPQNHTRGEIRECYHRTLWTAANLGLDISRYSRIVFDPQSSVPTGADYIAQNFAWESAAYYWRIAGVREAVGGVSGTEATDIASKIVGGSHWQSRREAYTAFFPVLNVNQN